MGAELPDQLSIDSDIMMQTNLLTDAVNDIIRYLEEQRLTEVTPIEPVGETQQIGDAIDKAIKEGEDETKD